MCDQIIKSEKNHIDWIINEKNMKKVGPLRVFYGIYIYIYIYIYLYIYIYIYIYQYVEREAGCHTNLIKRDGGASPTLSEMGATSSSSSATWSVPPPP